LRATIPTLLNTKCEVGVEEIRLLDPLLALAATHYECAFWKEGIERSTSDGHLSHWETLVERRIREGMLTFLYYDLDAFTRSEYRNQACRHPTRSNIRV
jgi:hypothetical protein